jgi:hypothetical protein
MHRSFYSQKMVDIVYHRAQKYGSKELKGARVPTI